MEATHRTWSGFMANYHKGNIAMIVCRYKKWYRHWYTAIFVIIFIYIFPVWCVYIYRYLFLGKVDYNSNITTTRNKDPLLLVVFLGGSDQVVTLRLPTPAWRHWLSSIFHRTARAAVLLHGELNVYIIYMYIPRAPITSILEGQPPKTRPFKTKPRVIWILDMYVYIHIYLIHLWYALWAGSKNEPSTAYLISVVFQYWWLCRSDFFDIYI